MTSTAVTRLDHGGEVAVVWGSEQIELQVMTVFDIETVVRLSRRDARAICMDLYRAAGKEV